MASLPLPDRELASIASAFALGGRFDSGAVHGNGHINDTYAVSYHESGRPVRYILQRINDRIFKDVPALMENIERVTAHAAAKMRAQGGDVNRRVLSLVRTRAGSSWHRDAQGGCWRCYHFIEGALSSDLIEHPWQAQVAAQAFGAFQALLVDLPGGRLRETIPQFHHTRNRFENLRRAIKADVCGRVASAAAEIDQALAREEIVDVLLNLQAQGAIPERVTHNDTKLNNVMLDLATREAVCVIDLDTVMPGLALYDFGDMVRSATNSTAEDDPEPDHVSMRMPIFEALVTGYLASAGAFLNEAERAHLVFSGKLITFEIGIRFLTDYLEGDVYFKTKHARHNLDRARNQLALVRSIEAQDGAMQAVVRRIQNAPAQGRPVAE